MNAYYKLAKTTPPLSVPIIIRKSIFKIANEAQILTLSSAEASLNWHTEELASRGFDEWMFVNPEDEYEWEQRLTEATSYE